MPTFSTIALENLLEPRVRDSYTKSPLSDRIAAPPPPPKRDESYTLQGREISVSKPSAAPRHIYISPALYATPEQAPIPDTASDPLSPSPYVVNHKRRGGGVGNRSGSGGVEIPAEEEGGELVVVEEEDVVQDNFGGGVEDELFGEEEDGFLDPRCESGSLGSRNEVTGQFDCRSFVSNQGEFFDAIEDFSSDTSNSNAPSYGSNLESELRALRLSLLEEIERHKQAEEDLSSMHSRWQRIIDLLSEVGIALPSPSNSSGSMQQNNTAIEDLAQEVVVARFVAHAIGKGQAQADAEIAAEAILESKDQEISRLRDKLQYYEAVNHEMSQRNQGIIELARQQRQRRKIRRRWFWSCIGVSVAIGVSAVAYSYLPQANKHQEGSSCSDTSTGSCISNIDTA